MSDEILDLNQGCDVEAGFVLHPDGYEGPIHCDEVKFQEDPATKKITAIVLKMDCDGAKVQEFISLKTTERYTMEIIKSKLSKLILSFGIRKVGEKSPRLMDDIKSVQGGWGHARLKIDKFQSKQTGKWLEGNKVDYFLSAEEFESRRNSHASGVTASASGFDSGASRQPATTAPKKFNFG